MKVKRFANVLPALLMFLTVPLAVMAADTGSITVQISGLNNDNGVVRIALYNDKEEYSKDRGSASRAFQKDKAPIKNKTATCTFSNLPYGDYAIKLYHDEDNSGKFKTGMFGLPKVQYGFSNNAKGMMGPATFDKAKFKVDSKEVVQNIKMQGR